jgi:hypothetical protein
MMKPIILFALLLLPAILPAAPLSVGDPLPALSLVDQHDKPKTISPDTRLVFFSASRDGASLIEDALAGQTGDSLAAAGIVYVADIDGMPPVVSKLVALPQMRKLPYPMLLGHEAEDTAMIPRERGKVTLIEAEGGTVTAIREIDDLAILKQALSAAQDQE